jgi:hypothetical protein
MLCRACTGILILSGYFRFCTRHMGNVSTCTPARLCRGMLVCEIEGCSSLFHIALALVCIVGFRPQSMWHIFPSVQCPACVMSCKKSRVRRRSVVGIPLSLSHPLRLHPTADPWVQAKLKSTAWQAACVCYPARFVWLCDGCSGKPGYPCCCCVCRQTGVCIA